MSNTAKQQWNPQFRVFINPLETKGSLPWISYNPETGWQVADSQTKGEPRPTIESAANRYNNQVSAQINTLNLASMGFSIQRVHIVDLPGWGDAQQAFREAETNAKLELVETPGCDCAACQAARAWEPPFAEVPPAPAKPASVPKAGLLAAIAAFLASEGINPPQAASRAVTPDCLAVLRDAKIAVDLAGLGVVAVMVPTKYGRVFACKVKDAIEAGDAAALRHLFATVGMP